jgi:hypothetical protein
MQTNPTEGRNDQFGSRPPGMVIDPTKALSDLLQHEVAQDAVKNRLSRKGLEQKQPEQFEAEQYGTLADNDVELGRTVAAPLETVQVKYRGPVDLGPFDCTDVTRSSFIHRVCFDKANSYMLINLAGTYYHYCEIDSGTVATLMSAESMGRFYNSAIKGRFDCRTHRVPAY